MGFDWCLVALFGLIAGCVPVKMHPTWDAASISLFPWPQGAADTRESLDSAVLIDRKFFLV
jgi:hypothetical protein